MKSISIAVFFIALLLNLQVIAQENDSVVEKKVFEFTDVIDIENTSVKNQYRSGTCWSFSGLAFVEAELLRMTGTNYDRSVSWAC